MEIPDYYHVEADSRLACKCCGAETLYEIVDATDTALGQSFGDKELTDDLCDYMNQAFRAGVNYANKDTQ